MRLWPNCACVRSQTIHEAIGRFAMSDRIGLCAAETASVIDELGHAKIATYRLL